MGSDSLRAACADVLNVYSKCELPTVWGPSDKVAADGCLIPTWDDHPRPPTTSATERPVASRIATLARITLPISRTSSWPAPIQTPQPPVVGRGSRLSGTASMSGRARANLGGGKLRN
jgi:hypothetical protein